MKAYEQIKEQYQKNVGEMNRLYWRSFWYPIGGFVVCTVGADLSLRNTQLNPMLIPWILFLSLILLSIPFRLAVRDAKKVKAIQDEIVDCLIQGFKLEKERRLGESYFTKGLSSHNARYGDKLLPVGLVIFLIFLRLMYLLILLRGSPMEFFIGLAMPFGACLYVAIPLLSFVREPYKRLQKAKIDLQERAFPS